MTTPERQTEEPTRMVTRETLAAALLTDGLWPVYDRAAPNGFRGGQFDKDYREYAAALFDALPSEGEAPSERADAAWEAEVMRLASSDNPRSRQHDERTADRRSMWRCVPISDIVGLREAALSRSTPTPCQYCGSVNGETPDGAFHPDPMSGDTLRAAIAAACDLTNPRLSEVDWDNVAAVFDQPERDPRDSLYHPDFNPEGYIPEPPIRSESTPTPDATDAAVSASAYRLALMQIEHDGEVKNRLTAALRVATHKPHDQLGEPDPDSGFPVCSVCGAIQTEPDATDALGAALERERDLRQALLEASYYHVKHDGTPRHPTTCSECRTLAERRSQQQGVTA